MKKIFLIIPCIFLLSMTYVESIYSYSITTIEGQMKPMADFQGKKILIITLPIQQNISNDSLLTSIDSLQGANSNSMVVIGVPAYEDGYTLALKTQLQQWYRSKLNAAIVITDGMYTRKTSGGQQSPLFQWLTDKTKNGSLNQDVTGERNKFFIWTDGQLLAALGAQVKLGGSTIRNLIE